MKAMDVGQRPERKTAEKSCRTCNYHGGGNANADAAGNAYYAETADPCEGCPHD